MFTRQDKKRPRQLLTNNGQHVLNLWFIPHHTEALVMYKNLADEKIVRALSFSLSIVSSIHDMLQYLCAHSRLGSSHARLGSQRMEFVSADWGGTEGIGRWWDMYKGNVCNKPLVKVLAQFRIYVLYVSNAFRQLNLLFIKMWEMFYN